VLTVAGGCVVVVSRVFSFSVERDLSGLVRMDVFGRVGFYTEGADLSELAASVNELFVFVIVGSLKSHGSTK
jgi:hypothetical protein